MINLGEIFEAFNGIENKNACKEKKSLKSYNLNLIFICIRKHKLKIATIQ